MIGLRLVDDPGDVHPAAHGGVQERPRPGVADQVQTGLADTLPGVHAYYHRFSATGARYRAERAAPGRRPSNLIRVVPA